MLGSRRGDGFSGVSRRVSRPDKASDRPSGDARRASRSHLTWHWTVWDRSPLRSGGCAFQLKHEIAPVPGQLADAKLPLATPQLPIVPRQPPATPVKTDAMGLPVLP